MEARACSAPKLHYNGGPARSHGQQGRSCRANLLDSQLGWGPWAGGERGTGDGWLVTMGRRVGEGVL